MNVLLSMHWPYSWQHKPVTQWPPTERFFWRSSGAMAAVLDKEFDFIKARQHQNIPGYGGHCPNVSGIYGTTYGNATKKTFMEREESKTSTSKISSLYRRTHSVPSDVKLYTKKNPSRPSSAHSTDVQLQYQLSHTGKRRDEVLNFNQDSQRHRNHYQDLTGTVHQVPSFTHRRVVSAPPSRFRATSEVTNSSSQGFATTSNTTPVSFLKYSKMSLNELRHPRYTHRQPTAREKKTRDVYFERR